MTAALILLFFASAVGAVIVPQIIIGRGRRAAEEEVAALERASLSCVELARYFLDDEGATHAQIAELAEDFQRAAEDAILRVTREAQADA